MTNPTIDFSKKTVLVWGSELHVEFAIRLSREFGKVYFHSNWKCSFPSSDSVMPGQGIEGIHRVLFPFDLIDEVDLWVFTDLLDQDTQVFLRRLGKRVWGCAQGENLELDRWGFYELITSLGMPAMPAELCHGIDHLEELLKKKENLVIKVSMWRGDFETHKHKNWRLSEQWLIRQRLRLGLKAKNMEFFVQEMVKDVKIEVGGDMWSIRGDFPPIAAFGYEKKDVGLALAIKPYNAIAKPIRWVNEKLGPFMRRTDYMGFFSSEIIIDAKGTPYFIDATTRLPTPPNELYQEMVRYWAPILWHGAEGRVVTPEWRAKYGFQALICSSIDSPGFEWQVLDFPEEFRDNIKIFNVSKVDDRWCCTPMEYHMDQIGAVVAWADDLQDAVEQVSEIAETIQGENIEVLAGSASEAVEFVEQGEAMGINF